MSARSTVFTALFILGVTAAALLLIGRTPWGAAEKLCFWSGDILSRFNSQCLFDPYSFTHVSHGLGLYLLLGMLTGRRRRGAALLAALALEGAWEVLENTDFIINRYRKETLSLHYYGDSVANSVTDTLVMIAGFLFAERFDVRSSLFLFLMVEAVLLYWIRDNLILNLIMLIYPIPALKQWQLGN
ncbi:MAG: DUF2585 family protein [Acidobacteria bacterium]|nr:DUF2585 family protein [Acidobacteriota bacterium]